MNILPEHALGVFLLFRAVSMKCTYIFRLHQFSLFNFQHISYALITDNALFCNYLQENDFCGFVLSTHIKTPLISLLSQGTLFVSNSMRYPKDCQDEDSSVPEHHWYVGVESPAPRGSILGYCCLPQPFLEAQLLAGLQLHRVWKGFPQSEKLEVRGWYDGMEEPSRPDELAHVDGFLGRVFVHVPCVPVCILKANLT